MLNSGRRRDNHIAARKKEFRDFFFVLTEETHRVTNQHLRRTLIVALKFIRKDLTCGSIGRHARLRGSFVAAVLEADNLVTFSQLFGREVSFVLISHFDSDGGSDEALLLSHAAQGEDTVDDHVEILVLVEIVDLEQILRFESERFASL